MIKELNSCSLHAVSTNGQPVAGGSAQATVCRVDDITFTTTGVGPDTTRTIVVDLQLTGGLSQQLNSNLACTPRRSDPTA